MFVCLFICLFVSFPVRLPSISGPKQYAARYFHNYACEYVHSHKSMNKVYYNKCEPVSSVYGDLRALLVGFFVITLCILYCLNDQVTQNRDARIHILHENIIIYFSISRSIDRNKTSTKLDQLDVCTSYCALHFDSITNKYSAP